MRLPRHSIQPTGDYPMGIPHPRFFWLMALAALLAAIALPAWSSAAYPGVPITAAGPMPNSPGVPPVIANCRVDCAVLGPRLSAYFGAAYECELTAQVSDPNGLSDIILVSATAPDGPIYKLYDNGAYGDMTPGDGIFQYRRLTQTPAAPGAYFFFSQDTKGLTDSIWNTFAPEAALPFPSVPTPVSPTHGATIQTTTPLLTWQASSNASGGYDVWVWDALPAGIDWSLSHLVWYANDLTTTSAAVPAGVLQSGRNYFWWVVARNLDPVEGNARAAMEYASFTVDTRGAISGQVRASGTGASIAGARVEAYLGDQLMASALTGANGVYTIGGLQSGQYVVAARKQGYVSQARTGIGVTDGQTSFVNFNLAISGRLKGQVLDRLTGAAIIGATVSARSGGVVRATGLTVAPYGIYEIDSDLPAGFYSLNASKAGYLDQGKTGISVIAGATTYVNFRLTPPPMLKGQVRDRVTGAPIIGASVSAYLGGDLQGSATTTAPWGIYEIYGDLPQGIYSLNASAAGYTDQSKIGIAVSPGTTTYVNFNLQPQ
jgi:hypothetical protein